uniref:Uncharacterized protein n=1 Tax=Pygocentrus nattereri TaxID=42514 RepID=A0AAR2J710_PYGNA
MPQCCVPHCYNRFESKKSLRLSFHRFPSDETERARWLQLISRENFTPNYNSRVCSWHFPNGKAAGPTRFAWNEGKSFQVSASVSEMMSEAESVEVESVAEGKDELAKHVQFHDCDRPFPCAICGKRFLSRSHHAEHQRVHTGERPFPCNRCERAFTTHHNLKRHQLIHDKEEMYRCSVCGVLFCQEHQLGNIGGIIRVLKQHNMENLIDPRELQEPESVPKAEPAVETLPNLSLKTIIKKEPNAIQKKRKHEHLHSDEDCSPFVDGEGKESPLSFHSQVSQIHTSKEKDFSDLGHRTGPRIQKIAYDIEIIL